MIEIDGSRGETGGQVLRSSMGRLLAAGRPIRMRSIGAGRERHGLLRQHLAAVELAARVGGAAVQGAFLDARVRMHDDGAGVRRVEVGA